MDRYAKSFAFGLHFEAIAQLLIGIVAECGQAISGAFAILELRNSVPLLGSRHQADIAVCGNPIVMLDDFNGAELLVPENRMKRILIHEDSQALSLKVAVVVDFEFACLYEET